MVDEVTERGEYHEPHATRNMVLVVVIGVQSKIRKSQLTTLRGQLDAEAGEVELLAEVDKVAEEAVAEEAVAEEEAVEGVGASALESLGE